MEKNLGKGKGKPTPQESQANPKKTLDLLPHGTWFQGFEAILISLLN